MDRGYKVFRKTHPKETANFFSLISFAYMFNVIRKSYKTGLEEDDLYRPIKKLEAKNLGDELEQAWKNEKLKSEHVSLLRLLVKCFGKKYLFLGCIQLIVKITHTVISPWAIGNFVSYFAIGQTEIDLSSAYIYGGLIVLVHFLHSAYEQHYILMKTEIGIGMYVGISSLMYRKTLKLNPTTFSEITTGKFITAMTKDLVSLYYAVHFAIECLLEAIQGIVIWYMIYTKLGLSSLVGASIFALIFPLQLIIGYQLYRKRQACNKKSDKRLKLTQEVLSYIRIIKMYTWERFFGKKLIEARTSELKNLRMLFIFKHISMTSGTFMTKVSFAVIVLAYIWLGNSVSAALVYYLTNLFHKLFRTMIFIPMGINSTAEFVASLRRLNVILNAEEIDDLSIPSDSRTDSPIINFVDAKVNIGPNTVLTDVSLKLKPGLNILVGPVGSGKSLLIKTILGEYKLNSGKTKIEGNISYACQNLWIFPSSLKQNIMFGQTFDEIKYQKVLEVCALVDDIETLDDKDETILIDSGVNLSKGQQARVNLARALYKDSDIYMLDDSLSSLDGRVEKYVFGNAIKNYLKNKLCILATHNTKFIKQADNVIILSQGTVAYSGKPTDIPEKLLKHVESAENENSCEIEETIEKNIETINHQKDNVEENVKNNKICVNEEDNLLENVYSAKKANIYYESETSGRAGVKTYKKYFQFGGGIFMFLLLVSLCITGEMLSGLGEKVISKWVVVEENITSLDLKLSMHNDCDSNLSSQILTKEFHNDELETTTVLYEDNFTFSEINCSWTESDLNNLFVRRNLYITLYITAISVSSLFVLLRAVTFFIFSYRVSRNVHNVMLDNVISATMSFFDGNLIGNILNRFSKDLYLVDEFISQIVNEAFRMAFVLCTTVIMMGTVSIMYGIMAIVATMFYFVICKFCVPSQKSLRKLEMQAISPIVGNLNATMEGLDTIRAFKCQYVLRNEFDHLLDMYSSTGHLKEVGFRALSFILSTMSSLIVGFLILRFLIIDKKNSLSGDVGFSISQMFTLTVAFEWSLETWVFLEAYMVCMERVLEFTKIKGESRTGQEVESWPSRGSIKFENVSLKYGENNKQVLKNLNFTINPNEKIGIVGRTGAGKSSIIASLFRLYEVDGKILIDDINIQMLSLNYLRNHIAIIPQDPVIFQGSIRTNVDPHGEHTDGEIWEALESVNLKPLIKSIDEDINETGGSLSMGQKQLICLIRAMLRKTKIIIMDEATANMDKAMDIFVHTKIEQLFKYCTLITVAHRLHSVMDCDKVMVLKEGEILEFDNPKILLENQESMFSKMVGHGN